MIDEWDIEMSEVLEDTEKFYEYLVKKYTNSMINFGIIGHCFDKEITEQNGEEYINLIDEKNERKIKREALKEAVTDLRAWHIGKERNWNTRY